MADSCHAAITAYLGHVESLEAPQSDSQITPLDYLAYLTTLPDNHPQMPGGQILTRSFDGGETWECLTRESKWGGWSLGILAEVAP